MKKFILGFILGACLFGTGAVFATEYVIKNNTFPIVFNGVQNNNIKALNIDGYTWFQLASLKETGLTVKFNETDRQIEITSETFIDSSVESILNNFDESKATNNEKYTPDGLKAKEINGTYYIMLPATIYIGKTEFDNGDSDHYYKIVSNTPTKGEYPTLGALTKIFDFDVETSNGSREEKILHDIPLHYVEEMFYPVCITYDYYMENIYPLLD